MSRTLFREDKETYLAKFTPSSNSEKKGLSTFYHRVDLFLINMCVRGRESNTAPSLETVKSFTQRVRARDRLSLSLSLLVLSVKHTPCHKRSRSSTLLTDQIRLWRDKKSFWWALKCRKIHARVSIRLAR